MTFTTRQRAAAWGVHLYTALGLPLAFLCVEALARGQAARFFVFAAVACWVDATDGFFARKLRVKEVLPDFSGRRLDDIVDFLHFVCIPMLALPALGMIPPEMAWTVTIPLLASGYGFCQEAAKTDDAFVGFPSYWNIAVLYAYVLGLGPTAIVGSMWTLAFLIFVPIHYVYPSRTELMQKVTVGLGFVWGAMIFAVCMRPDASWARSVAMASLFYVAYYAVLSGVHHMQIKRRLEAA